jgi:hypothetical protein
MTLTLDVSGDWSVWDGVEQVTVYPTPRNDLTFFPVSNALGRSLTFAEVAPSGGVYTRNDRVWLLPVATSQALTAEFPLVPGFAVVDGTGSTWTVLEVGLNTLKSHWRCVTRNLVLAAGLRDTVTIIRPRVTYGPSGSPAYDWSNATAIVTDLPARVQPTAGNVEAVNDIESMTKEYRVTLAQEVSVRAFDRVDWRDAAGIPGPPLQILSSANSGRIDVLPELLCKAWI